MRGVKRVRSGEIKCSFSNFVSFIERWSKSVLFQSFCSRQKSSLLKSFESERKILAMRLPLGVLDKENIPRNTFLKSKR